MTKIEAELLETKLEAERISSESMKEFNVEARQAYLSGLVEKWLSRLPRELGEYSGLPFLDSEEQTAFPDQQEKSSSSHWCRDVFQQSRPSTPLGSTVQPSVSLGEHEPGTMARLNEEYVSLIELSFDNGDIIV